MLCEVDRCGELVLRLVKLDGLVRLEGLVRRLGERVCEVALGEERGLDIIAVAGGVMSESMRK